MPLIRNTAGYSFFLPVVLCFSQSYLNHLHLFLILWICSNHYFCVYYIYCTLLFLILLFDKFIRLFIFVLHIMFITCYSCNCLEVIFPISSIWVVSLKFLICIFKIYVKLVFTYWSLILIHTYNLLSSPFSPEHPHVEIIWDFSSKFYYTLNN